VLENYDDDSTLEFEWDSEKNESNLAKHGLDFEDVSRIFYGSILVRRSNRNNEERWIAIGSLERKLVAVVFARRAGVVRIISARRARPNEEREYRNAEMGRSSKGPD
jgi:uncharacterized protein